jgi:hypothetical protein
LELSNFGAGNDLNGIVHIMLRFSNTARTEIVENTLGVIAIRPEADVAISIKILHFFQDDPKTGSDAAGFTLAMTLTPVHARQDRSGGVYPEALLKDPQ